MFIFAQSHAAYIRQPLSDEQGYSAARQFVELCLTVTRVFLLRRSRDANRWRFRNGTEKSKAACLSRQVDLILREKIFVSEC
jgi:hypothetical protein